MDPDDRLREELGQGLRGALGQLKLDRERRGQLLQRMVEPSPLWRRWPRSLRGAARRPGLLGPVVAGAAVAVGVAAALIVQLSAPPSPPGRAATPLQSSSPISAQPAFPPESAEPGAGRPSGCSGKGDRVSPAETHLTLGRAESSSITVVVSGPACGLTATVLGPGRTSVRLTALPPSAAESAGEEDYRIRWAGSRDLAPGTYTISLQAGKSGGTATIQVSVRS